MMTPPMTVPEALDLIKRHVASIGKLRAWLALQPAPQPGFTVHGLTPAELLVARGLACRLTAAQIAKGGQVTVGTAYSQISSIYDRLGVTRRDDAITLLRLAGLHLGAS